MKKKNHNRSGGILPLLAFGVGAAATLVVFTAAAQAQGAKGEELLDLPSFSPEKDDDQPRVLELELLTTDELESLYSESQKESPLPEGTVPTKALSMEPLPSSQPQEQQTVPPADPTPSQTELPKTADSTPLPETPPAETPPPAAEPKETPASPPVSTADSSEKTPSEAPVDNLKDDFISATKDLIEDASLFDQQAGIPPAKEWKSGSLMFQRRDVELLMSAIAEYKKRAAMTPGGFAIPSIETTVTSAEEPVSPRLNYPIIYVGTIMYLAPEHWSVWINGRKFSSQGEPPLEALEVKSISAEKVTLRWTPNIPVETYEKNTDLIEQSEEGFLVTMRSNQALLAKMLTMNEGRVIDKNVQEIINTNRAATPAASEEGILDQVTGAVSGPPATGIERDKMNMDKLINQYKAAGDALGIEEGGP